MFYFSLFLMIWAAPAILLLSVGVWVIMRARFSNAREATRPAGEVVEGES
jgi:hypothetical protein